MGVYTTNGILYKPTYGESGLDNMNRFNNALEVADGKIKALETYAFNGKVPNKTTVEIQAIVAQGTSTTVYLFFNTTRNSLEMWIGFSLAKVL